MTNKKAGNSFEAELCEELAKHGFWAHNMTQNQTGQPADVIAVRDNKAYLIDCKVCSHDEFPLSRIEPNQESAMNLFRMCGNGHSYFALKLTNENIYMIPFTFLDAYADAIGSTLKKKDIVMFLTLEQWVELRNGSRNRKPDYDPYTSYEHCIMVCGESGTA